MITEDPDFEALVAPLAIAEEKGRPRVVLTEALRHYFWKNRASIPPERRVEAERLAKQFVTDGEDLLHRDDRSSVPQLVGDFARQMQILSQPVPMPTPDTEITRVAPVLVSESGCGWASIEVDFLRQWLRMGERLVRYDRWGVETDSRRAVTRAELRSSMRPVTWRNDLSWESQFEGHDIPARGAN